MPIKRDVLGGEDVAKPPSLPLNFTRTMVSGHRRLMACVWCSSHALSQNSPHSLRTPAQKRATASPVFYTNFSLPRTSQHTSSGPDIPHWLLAVSGTKSQASDPYRVIRARSPSRPDTRRSVATLHSMFTPPTPPRTPSPRPSVRARATPPVERTRAPRFVMDLFGELGTPSPARGRRVNVEPITADELGFRTPCKSSVKALVPPGAPRKASSLAAGDNSRLETPTPGSKRCFPGTVPLLATEEDEEQLACAVRCSKAGRVRAPLPPWK